MASDQHVGRDSIGGPEIAEVRTMPSPDAAGHAQPIWPASCGRLSAGRRAAPVQREEHRGPGRLARSGWNGKNAGRGFLAQAQSEPCAFANRAAH